MTVKEGRLRQLAGFLGKPRGAWLALGVAMAIAAALILYAADGETFDIDEYFYFGRLVGNSGQIVEYHSLSLGYLLAPYNGHLQLGGKLIYEFLFALFGTNYLAFELINVAALCACVALVFELTWHRVGPLAALAPCVLLLFLGFAREVLLWPFDMHTLVSLTAGLGAMAVLRRDDRRGDVIACLLLTASIATIELGLAFAVGIAVSVCLRSDRLRRLWIFLIPVALYALWWVWARHFDQSQVIGSNIPLALKTYVNALAAVIGSLTATVPVEPATYAVTVTAFAEALAVLAAIGLVVRIWHGPVTRQFWIWFAVLVAYWAFLTVAARPPGASRYVFPGAVFVLLVAAETLRGVASARLTTAIVIVVLVALPANIGQLLDEREHDTLHADAGVSRTEFAMIELARDHVDPSYVVSSDPRVSAAGGNLFIGLPAGAYLDSAERNGSLAYSLPELRRQPEKRRRLADVALVGALDLALQPASPGGNERRHCVTAAPAGASTAKLKLPSGRALLLARGPRSILVAVRRFASTGSGVAIANLQPGGWVSLTVPPDAAPDPWHVVLGGPATVCLPR